VTHWPIKHALIAGILIAIELPVGFGIIGVPAAIIAAVVLLNGKQRFGVRLQVAALYLCVSVLTFTWLGLQRAPCQTQGDSCYRSV